MSRRFKMDKLFLKDKVNEIVDEIFDLAIVDNPSPKDYAKAVLSEMREEISRIVDEKLKEHFTKLFSGYMQESILPKKTTRKKHVSSLSPYDIPGNDLPPLSPIGFNTPDAEEL